MQKIFFENLHGDKLSGILSGPLNDKSCPIIIMVHGFISSKDSRKFVELEKIFNQNNVSTFRFDVYGHGESEGKFENVTVSEAVEDVLQAIVFLQSQGYTKIGLIGSSFGGISSAIAASKTKDLLVLGLICPVSEYEEVEYIKRSEKGILEWKEKGFTYSKNEKTGEELKLNYSFFEDLKNNNVYDVAEGISIPTIIVHGDEDTIVPIQSLKTSKLIPQCKLVIIRGANHHFTDENNFQEMIKEVSDFILSFFK